MVKCFGVYWFLVLLAFVGIGVMQTPKATASEFYPRYFYSTSALIVVIKESDSEPYKYQPFGGFSPSYKIGQFMHPRYLDSRKLVNGQKYTGFKHVYKNRCRRCQRYTGFKKVYRGPRYLGFDNNQFPAKYPTSSY